MAYYRRIPLPIGKTRLFGSIAMAFGIGFLLFLAAANLGWFTPTRQLYLFYGVIAGVLLGVVETRTVIPKLVANTEFTTWKILPVAIFLFAIPSILVVTFLGASEYYPFGAFAFLPAIPAVGITSGYYFNKFENQQKVGVFSFYLGFKYWTQPNPDHTERFHEFLKDVASKDPSNFWGQVGSSLGYVGYSNIFIGILKEKQEIDTSTRDKLITILKIMNRYRIAGLTILLIFLLSTVAFAIVLFGSLTLHIDFGFKITGYMLGISSLVIFLWLCIGTLTLTTIFKRKLTSLLENVDADNISKIRTLVNQEGQA